MIPKEAKKPDRVFSQQDFLWISQDVAKREQLQSVAISVPRHLTNTGIHSLELEVGKMESL